MGSNFRRISARRMPRIAPFKEDVLSPSKLRMKAGSHFEQRADPTAEFHHTLCWIGDAGEDLQQRGLARPVPPHDAKNLTPTNIDVDALQGPYPLSRLPASTRRPSE